MLGVSEIIEFGERFDIGLGERGQFVAGRRLAVLAEPLYGEGRIHFVEFPGVAHARDLAVGGEDDLAADRDPDMRMRPDRNRAAERQEQGEEKETQAHVGPV